MVQLGGMHTVTALALAILTLSSDHAASASPASQRRSRSAAVVKRGSGGSQLDAVKGAAARSAYERDLAARATWTSLGCTIDQPARTLSVQATVSGGMTVEKCQAACGSYLYAAVQYGSQCFCGNTLDNGGGGSAPSSDCNVPCSGASGQTCGGSYRSNLYKQSISANPGPAYTALGCYTDSATRLLTGPSANLDAMTPASCVAYCKQAGYAYAGAEYAKQCFCGNSFDASKKIADSNCNSRCTGDSSQFCGGTWTLNLFSIGSTTPQPTSSPTTTTTTTATTTTTTTQSTATGLVSANAAVASQIGLPPVPAAGSARQLFAHHMVDIGNSYTQATWREDMTAAQAAGIDAFALNSGGRLYSHIPDAYAAAESLGFKVFISVDMTAYPCGGANNAQDLATNWIARFYRSPAQVYYGNSILLGMFAGDQCTWGQGNSLAGYAYLRQLVSAATGGRSVHIVPSLFLDPSTFVNGGPNSWMDGHLNWNSGWPQGNYNLDGSQDTSQMAYLAPAGKTYMAAISPLFFTYYAPNIYNKDWIYRSDNWLLATRFEQVISMRGRIPFAEIISWNDYGESHYVGQLRSENDRAFWSNSMPHDGFRSLIAIYAQAYKNGAYPTLGDNIWLWSRPHPKAATASNPTNPLGRPTRWETTEDNLYAVVTLASPATVTIASGSNTATWNLGAGMSKLSIASAAGPVSANIRRSGYQVKSVNSAGSFSYTLTPSDYNFNYWVGSA